MSDAWREEVRQLLEEDDVTGFIAREVKRSKKKAKKQKRLGSWSLEEAKAEAQSKAEPYYRNTLLRKRIFESIRVSYWQFLIDHCKNQRSIDTAAEGTVQVAFGRRLGVDKATISRWNKKVEFPDGDKVLAVPPLVLRAEASSIPYPLNRDVLWSAVQRTLALIRREDLGEPPCPDLDRDQFRFVRHLLLHPASDVYLGETTGPAAEKVYEAVLADFERRKWRTDSIRERAGELAEEWLEPYAMFRFGLLNGWEFIDEQAASLEGA